LLYVFFVFVHLLYLDVSITAVCNHCSLYVSRYWNSNCAVFRPLIIHLF